MEGWESRRYHTSDGAIEAEQGDRLEGRAHVAVSRRSFRRLIAEADA
jgi:hypothetical protein